jgi:hypothetical protein
MPTTSRWHLTRPIAIVVAISLAVLMLPAPASADQPTIEELRFEVVDEAVAVCFAGSPDEFAILSSYVLELRAILFEGTVADEGHTTSPGLST